jgi:Zn-dependent alcohol dehydrogenase
MTEALEARGLVLDRLVGRPRLERLTVAPPGPGEVRVRLRAAGLCQTDVTQARDARFTPILLGHEGAGEIESVGEGVDGLAPGQHVLVCWRVPCGRLQAALVGCAVATGVGATLWTARVEDGASVAVFGGGEVGLNVVVGARLAGAARIVAVDPDESRRALALARGATETVTPGSRSVRSTMPSRSSASPR